MKLVSIHAGIYQQETLGIVRSGTLMRNARLTSLNRSIFLKTSKLLRCIYEVECTMCYVRAWFSYRYLSPPLYFQGCPFVCLTVKTAIPYRGSVKQEMPPAIRSPQAVSSSDLTTAAPAWSLSS